MLKEVPREIAASAAEAAPKVQPPIMRSPPKSPVQEATGAVLRPEDRDSYSVTAMGEVTDRALHVAIARFTGGLSPSAIGAAYLDWAVHLAAAPGKQWQLVDKAVRKAIRFASYAHHCVLEGGTSFPIPEAAAGRCTNPA